MQIDRKRTLKGAIDADGLIDGIARWHDDHQIDVALRVRPAVGIGAEQDNLIRMKPLRNLAGEASDCRERNVRRRIAVRLDVRCRNSALLGHDAIVLNPAGVSLGLASPSTLRIDTDAAGWGWFVDLTLWAATLESKDGWASTADWIKEWYLVLMTRACCFTSAAYTSTNW